MSERHTDTSAGGHPYPPGLIDNHPQPLVDWKARALAASLDQPLPSEEGCLADAVPDSVQSAAISGAEHRRDRKALADFLERSLPPRQALVLRLMAGLHPDHPGGLTRRQIAARMGVSGTRVSMLVQEAAARLTATPQRAAALRALLGGHE